MSDTESGVPVGSVQEDKDPGAPEESEKPELVKEHELNWKLPENHPLRKVGTVYMKDDRYPEGTIIEVPGLGGVPNGGSKEVDEVQTSMFQDNFPDFEWPEDGNLTFPVATKVEEVTE